MMRRGRQMASGTLNGAVIVSLFASFLIGCPADAQSVSKTVAVGGVLKLSHYASVNPDCSPLGMPVVRLSFAPRHGVITTVKRSDFSHFSAAHYDRCNSRRVLGVSAEYRPTRGFTG